MGPIALVEVQGFAFAAQCLVGASLNGPSGEPRADNVHFMR